ncbi:peroxisome- protein [Irineochytrium annulatum]|nr:peroxisome- protein [Irineochytrium annulatum]
MHNFDVFTYSRPTYCDLCDKFLWGIVKQGCQCRDCGYNVHKKCQHLVATTCSGVRAPGVNNSNQGHFDTRHASDDDEDEDSYDSEVTMAASNQSAHYAGRSKSLAALNIDDHLLPASANASPRAVARRVGPNRSRTIANGGPSDDFATSPTSGSLLQDLLASTAKESMNIKKASKDAAPPLNLLTTTPKNFTKFVSRVGPVVELFDTIEGIMTWKEPSATIIALLCYIILCIYPTLFIILPQIFLLYLITKNYYKKTKLETVGKKAAGLQPSLSTTSAQYIKNMQFIQNQMGMFCDVHAEVGRSLRLIDWSDEKQTTQIVKAAAGSALGVIVVVRLIPVNVIMLIAGVAAFFSNTAFFRAASTTLPPVIIKGLSDRVDSIREGIAAARRAPEGSVVTVTLFENQRWWAGLGWIPHLLRSERPPWSDETGAIPRPSKETFELPANDPAGTWAWVDPDWKADLGWTDQLDEGGWSYTDHVWAVPKGKAAVGSLTRRRAWIRQMKMTPNRVVGGVAAVAEVLSLKKAE